MSADPVSPPAPESLTLAQLVPQGGGKWAHCFAGPEKVMVSGGGLTIRAGAVVHPDGEVFEDVPAAGVPAAGVPAPAGETLTQHETEVFPLAAGMGVTLGRFLTGALAASIASADIRQFNYCGARLSPRQAEVLRKLRKAEGYITLDRPARFRTVISPSEAGGKFIPGPYIRALAGWMRAPAAAEKRRLAILPARETERFALTNRASLVAWLRAKKFELIEPEAMAFDHLAAVLAAASLIILADSEQAGLVSLCAPGAKILEIAPEGWLGATARCVCRIFGADWIAFLATAPAYPLLHAIPLGARVPLSYEIPIRALAKTLDALV